MLTVALIGADGSGKTTVSDRLQTELGLPTRSIYMGVNMYRSEVLLPHTRLLVALRRRKHGDDPEAASDIQRFRPAPTTVPRRALASARSSLRLANWLAEEAYRLWVARRHTRRGQVVIFDRHFFADFFVADICADGTSRPLAKRIHGFMLQHVFPKPDLVVCLDAPAEVLYARKPEGTLERVRQKRKESLAALNALPNCLVVDAARPLDEVVSEVATAVRTLYERRLQERRSGKRFSVRPLRRVKGRRS
jgi:thymidylate kinase